MAECRPRVSTRSAKLCAIAGPASGHAALSDRISGSNELQLISGLRNDEPQRETSVAQRRQPQAKPEHIRGTVESLQDGVLTVATSNGSMPIRIEPSTLIDRMVRSDRAQIAEGSYLGIVSVPQADGSQRGVEVLLFSEALRGQAEGTAPWDWPGAQGGSKMTNGTASKMTNGTVSRSKMTNGTVTSQAGGSSLTLQYKNGKSAASQTIAIPSDVPVVAVEPGQLADIQTGAYVFVVATRDAGRALTAALVLAGKDGLVSRI